MDSIPVEIGTMVAKWSSREDLGNMRLVSKSMSRFATSQLFSSQHIILPRVDERPEIIESLNNIAASPNLAKAVRFITFSTTLHPDLDLDQFLDLGEPEPTVFSSEMAQAIGLLKQFSGVTHVKIQFDRICSNIVSYDDFNFRTEPAETLEFRTQILRAVLAALNDLKHPIHSLKSLEIENLQNVNDSTVVESEDFKTVLRRISELKLRIVTEQDIAAPELAWNFEEMYNFMDELPIVWLKPVRENLMSLAIRTDELWGYFPRCELRKLHFPRLRKLHLRNWTITHDWQINWVVSHGETLEELVLEDCPVIIYFKQYGPLDAEKYSVAQAETRSGDTTSWQYGGRWSKIFRRLETELPNVTKLEFASKIDNWRMPMEEPLWHRMDMELGMYMSFHRGLGPSPFCDADEAEYEDGPEACKARREEVESWFDEDKDAYLKLMATIKRRSG